MLIDRLREYGQTDYYPFHMPGHKRQIKMGITSFPNPFSVDITEIEGFDNLHHAEGILRASMDYAASVYGSDRSWYLVNGSTGGILSAICAAANPGEKILMARNSHKAAYNAVAVHRLAPVYVYPDVIKELGIQGGVRPEAVKAVLEREKNIKCIYITSPTYEGIVSDVREIAQLAHRHGILLIVDEAHGAHFPFGESFPESALDCGADIVIQSLHKTLPSLTQTAIMHLKSSLISPEQVERYLTVFQSSSPSYVFLSSIDACVRYMAGRGKEDVKRYEERLSRFYNRIERLENLKYLDDRICGKYGVYGRDPSKLVFFPPAFLKADSGPELASVLREKYHLEAEMACCSYALFMTSLMDTEEGFERLLQALYEIDAQTVQAAGAAQDGSKEIPVPSAAVKIPADAWCREGEKVLLSHAAGRISGTFVVVYPPGIPLLVPGERIDSQMTEQIEKNRQLGITVEGIDGDSIRVLL